MCQTVHDDVKSQLQTTAIVTTVEPTSTVPLGKKMVQIVNEPFSVIHMHRLIIIKSIVLCIITAELFLVWNRD